MVSLQSSEASVTHRDWVVKRPSVPVCEVIDEKKYSLLRSLTLTEHQGDPCHEK